MLAGSLPRAIRAAIATRLRTCFYSLKAVPCLTVVATGAPPPSPSGVTMSERRYRGFAGHFCASEDCLFHITTEIGDVLVSTVGAYRVPQPHGRHRNGEPWGEIGMGRKYETMVFRMGSAVCSCGCGEREISSHNEIDFAGYNDVKSATEGHEAMCQKYETIAPNGAA